MREIKFRSWDGKKIDPDPAIWGSHENGECWVNYSIAEQQERGVVLMQYTGLKDKNGKEIYEGDVVTCYWEDWGAYNARKDCPVRQKVEWDTNVCGFAPFAHYDSDCGQNVVMSGVEVLGNIYENPELLNEA